MKIALIAPTDIPSRRANTMQVMKMAQALVQVGHEVRMAIPSAGGRTPAEAGPQDLARHYGLHTEFPRAWLRATPALRRYDYSLRALAWARRWGPDGPGEADLIYTRLPQAAALGSLLGRPTVFEMHDLPAPGWNTRLVNLFLRGAGAQRLVVITQALAQDLAAAFPRLAHVDVQVAPDGVDLERYADLPAPAEARLRLARQGGGPALAAAFTVGYTGHLYPGRGVELLLELAAQLPDMQFLLVGGEPGQVQRLAQYAAAGRHNLVLTGFVPNAVLPLYQAACDVLVMPYGEHVAASSGGDIARYLSPMKLFEYLACGRAILSSDLPVLTEVLNPANAVLLPGLQMETWAAALRQLQADHARRAALAQQARTDALQYTWEGRARRILADLPHLPRRSALNLK